MVVIIPENRITNSFKKAEKEHLKGDNSIPHKKYDTHTICFNLESIDKYTRTLTENQKFWIIQILFQTSEKENVKEKQANQKIWINQK